MKSLIWLRDHRVGNAQLDRFRSRLASTASTDHCGKDTYLTPSGQKAASRGHRIRTSSGTVNAALLGIGG